MMNKNNLKEQKHEGQEKVYTQEEFEKKLSQMKAQREKENEEKILSERDDAAKMATMSADERARAEMEKRQKAFDAERSQYMLEKMEFEAGKELAKHNLPLSFAKLLSGNDIDDTISNIDNFKQEFLKAVEAALAERLKGATPKTGNAPAAEYDPFLSGFSL